MCERDFNVYSNVVIGFVLCRANYSIFIYSKNVIIFVYFFITVLSIIKYFVLNNLEESSNFVIRSDDVLFYFHNIMSCTVGYC